MERACRAPDPVLSTAAARAPAGSRIPIRLRHEASERASRPNPLTEARRKSFLLRDPGRRSPSGTGLRATGDLLDLEGEDRVVGGARWKLVGRSGELPDLVCIDEHWMDLHLVLARRVGPDRRFDSAGTYNSQGGVVAVPPPRL